MFFCTTTDYAIQIMIEIAGKKGVTPSSVLSERIGVSQKYLKKITARLKGAGLLKSIPGHYGGYMLSRDPAQVTLWDIFAAIETNRSLIEVRKTENESESSAAVKKLHNKMNRSLEAHFRAISLAELVIMGRDEDGLDI